eukprot:Blabericola_migrator_1__2273@NODE_1629_length_4140_cov_9_186840_g1061_i0_p1_GENE_NODE_1629_length_4140_cov_9_186840_g1061_i0NODE_1629_length_4140_cov_9_186840_g1061_i0_p1_ORF_typecomplete_len823_score93_94zfMIZ/PF02891_20/2e02zfMIZ/PF02891_20/1_7e03zfMIZ/PF02891_20/6_6e17PINIT/PF14324_6/9_6e07PINIT/PF14324_6/5_9e02zfNse/PF11789_8/4e03zfNse/PF11789_8/1_2e05PHD/PF00628_29/0_00015PHD/PF00628_29/41Zf_RING/PF16744_5/0_19Zf_RING/PF16744_5/4_5PHD_4/PF16866_5/0_013PHD_4/PF16866_5/13zfDi19/PF05605_12/0_1
MDINTLSGLLAASGNDQTRTSEAELPTSSSPDFSRWAPSMDASLQTHHQQSNRLAKKRRVDSQVSKLGMCLCKGRYIPDAQLNSAHSLYTCPYCQQKYHEKCLGIDVLLSKSVELPEKFICPRCRVKDIDPFYPTVGTMHLQLLWDDVKESCHQWARRSLPLNSPNIHELRRKGSEVFVYCLKVLPDKLQNWQLHEWPEQVKVTVNKQEEVINKPEYEHKRRDVPMKITPYLTAEVPSNDIEVTALNFESDKPAAYFVAVCLCSRMLPQEIYQSIVERQALSVEEAEHQAMEKIDNFFGLQGDEDDDVGVVASTLRVKLICPITLTKIQTPVRGRKCAHLQCYDLMSYLQVTKATRAFNNRWKCVECNTITKPKDLVVDTYFQKLLKTTEENAEAVDFKADRSWEQVLSAVSSTLDQMDEDESRVAAMAREEAAAQALNGGSENPIDLVDLDSSSSEGEQSPELPEDDSEIGGLSLPCVPKLDQVGSSTEPPSNILLGEWPSPVVPQRPAPPASGGENMHMPVVGLGGGNGQRIVTVGRDSGASTLKASPSKGAQRQQKGVSRPPPMAPPPPVLDQVTRASPQTSNVRPGPKATAQEFPSTPVYSPQLNAESINGLSRLPRNTRHVSSYGAPTWIPPVVETSSRATSLSPQHVPAQPHLPQVPSQIPSQASIKVSTYQHQPQERVSLDFNKPSAPAALLTPSPKQTPSRVAYMVGSPPIRQQHVAQMSRPTLMQAPPPYVQAPQSRPPIPTPTKYHTTSYQPAFVFQPHLTTSSTGPLPPHLAAPPMTTNNGQQNSPVWFQTHPNGNLVHRPPQNGRYGWWE